MVFPALPTVYIVITEMFCLGIALSTGLFGWVTRIQDLYKKHGQIEQMFDDYKNRMDLDLSYLQSDSTMEAWCLSGIRIDRTLRTWMYDVLSKGPKDVLKNLRLQLPKLAEFLPLQNAVLRPEGHST
jgi:hypothetical protein